jgi:RNA polymerase sigma factor (sigma-70 family)
MVEQGPQVTWKEYDSWRASLTRDQRIMGGAHGQWPEGTPQVFIDLEARITVEERLLGSIFGERGPSVEEILTRPADYLERQKEVRQSSHRLLKEQVEDVLATLTEKENKVMRLRFGLEDGHFRTQAQVGQEIGRSRWTAGRIEKRALQKLRRPSTVQPLKDYLA